MKGDRPWRRSPGSGLIEGPVRPPVGPKRARAALGRKAAAAAQEDGQSGQDPALNRSGHARARGRAPGAHVVHGAQRDPSTQSRSRSVSLRRPSWRSGRPTQWSVTKSREVRSQLPTTISWISGRGRSAWSDPPNRRSARPPRSWTTVIAVERGAGQTRRSEDGSPHVTLTW